MRILSAAVPAGVAARTKGERSVASQGWRGSMPLLVGLLLAMAVFDAAKSYANFRLAAEPFPGWGYALFEAIPWLAWIALLPILYGVLRVAPIERFGRLRTLGLFATVAMILATVQCVMAAAARASIVKMAPWDQFSMQFEWLFPEFLPLGMAVCGALVLGVLTIDYRNRWENRDAPEPIKGDPSAETASTDEEAGEPWVTRLTIRSRDRIRFVPAETVDWLKADGNYVRVQADGEEHRIRGTLTKTLSTLDPNLFVRIHRSTVVNVARIREIEPWFSGDFLAILENGEKLKVSRRYRPGLF